MYCREPESRKICRVKRKEIRKRRKTLKSKSLAFAFEWKRRHWLLSGLLVFTILLYSGSLRQTFLAGWDDGEYIDNPDIQHLTVENVGSYFSTFYMGMYQPIPVLSFALNHYFSGSDATPYKFFNLLLHLVNILLVYFLARSLRRNEYAALLAAMLMALHPMHVESIAWLSARSTGLFTMFYLLALLAYWRYLEHNFRFKYIFIAFVFFLFALFSKSMAATLPMVLFVMDAWRRRSINKAAILEKIPFFIVSVIFGLVSIRAAASFGHIEVLEADYHLFDRIFLLSYGVAFYLVKLIFPLQLSAIYAYPAKTAGWLPAEYYLSFLLLILVAFGIYRLRRYRRETFLGFAFFILSVSMVLPLFWSRLFIVAERYVYLPYIGLFLVAGIWLKALIEGEITMSPMIRTRILALAGAWLLFFAVSTYTRTGVWQSTRTLMEDVVDKKRSSADQAFAWFFLGNVSDRDGNMQQAERYYSRAIELNPKHIQALNNRGIMRGSLGDFNGSLQDFNYAISLKANYAEAWYNRGIIRYQTGQSPDACNDWHKAAQLGFSQAQNAIRNYCK